jgi:hypothetical protein
MIDFAVNQWFRNLLNVDMLKGFCRARSPDEKCPHPEGECQHDLIVLIMRLAEKTFDVLRFVQSVVEMFRIVYETAQEHDVNEHIETFTEHSLHAFTRITLMDIRTISRLLHGQHTCRMCRRKGTLRDYVLPDKRTVRVPMCRHHYGAYKKHGQIRVLNMFYG